MSFLELYAHLISRLNSEWILMQMYWYSLEKNIIRQSKRSDKRQTLVACSSWATYFLMFFPLIKCTCAVPGVDQC